MTPGIYNLPNMRRGDTVAARKIVEELKYADGTPIGITSAKLQLRDPKGRLAYEWSTINGGITISGVSNNSLTLNRVESVVTSTWPPAVCKYELEIVTSANDTWTILAGSAPIDADETR